MIPSGSNALKRLGGRQLLGQGAFGGLYEGLIACPEGYLFLSARLRATQASRHAPATLSLELFR